MAVKLRFDRASLPLPLMGGLILKFHLARLRQTLGLLLPHGVNMLSAQRAPKYQIAITFG